MLSIARLTFNAALNGCASLCSAYIVVVLVSRVSMNSSFVRLAGLIRLTGNRVGETDRACRIDSVSRVSFVMVRLVVS